MGISAISIKLATGPILMMERRTVATSNRLVLSRLRSGLSTHLCGLPLESQGAFAAER